MSATPSAAGQEWFTHPSFTDSTDSISFAGERGHVRCQVIERVFCVPEGVRLHSSFVRAAPPAEAREMLRRQRLAEMREELRRLGLSRHDRAARLGPPRAAGARAPGEEAAAPTPDAPPPPLVRAEAPATPAGPVAAAAPAAEPQPRPSRVSTGRRPAGKRGSRRKP